MSFATIAEKLNIPLSIIKKESMRNFLERKLLEVETELFTLVSKYDVRGIKEFDGLIKSGKIRETADNREDFFRIDALEADRDAVRDLIANL